MHFLKFLSFFFFLLRSFATDDGLTTAVTWDPYSLSVNGEKVYIFAAEFHYQRLPVPELWLDVFQKFRASGFNTISIYLFWSFHSPAKDVYDFETPNKDLQRLFDTAKEAGLYVIARAGPYCNAETNAGGLALYLSDGSGGRLRTSDETYYNAWKPWVENVGRIIAANQITNGGPVILNQIENELQETVHEPNNTLVNYMEQVEAAFRDAGVIVPFSHNEKGERSQSWSTDYQDVGGAVNVYGLDSYPGGLSCTNPNSGFDVVRNYYQWFQNYSFTQPEYFPEFRAGYFTPWGGSFYDDCATELSPEYPDVFYKNNIGQKATLLSLYMTFGGTNWGQSAAPVVYSSYDYSAPLRETREIRDKLSQIKLIGLFTRVSTDLQTTNMEGNGTMYSSDPSVFTWVLRNPDTQAGFYTVQHATTSSRVSTTFDLDVNTSAGILTLPNINLEGRQSKIVVTDYKFGDHTLLYSTADILTYGTFGGVDVIFLYLNIGQTGQFAFKNSANISYTTCGAPTNFTKATTNQTSTFTYTQATGATVVSFSNNALFYLLDKATAWKFWAVPTTINPDVSPSEHIFVLGPYLVRSATVSGTTIELTGDTSNSIIIEVYAGQGIKTLIWNGNSLSATKTSYGSLTAQLSGTQDRSIDLPALTDWLVADSLPEISPLYDDSNWTICDKITTLSPTAPLTLPVLFTSDYGFYAGAKIYRGRFDSSNGNSTAVKGANITSQNGVAAGMSAWLNGDFVGSISGNATVDLMSLVLDFTGFNNASTNSSPILKDRDNILTILVDYTGHDETSTRNGVENPRGLLGATLISSSQAPTNNTSSSGEGPKFTSWRICGAAPDHNPSLDPVRGPLNEGGLYGERVGWHLPSFDPSASSDSSSSSAFRPGSPLTGLRAPGVAWYLTSFTLNIDDDLDVPLGIRLSSPSSSSVVSPVRVQLFVNGYQYGKYVPHIGPQTVFPVPPGIINNNGENVLGLLLWAMEEGGGRLEGVELVAYGVYESGFLVGEGGFAGLGGGLQPGWSVERMQYT